MKKVIRTSPAGIFSISKQPGQKKYRLYYQGSENSVEILIQIVNSEEHAQLIVNKKLKTNQS